MVEENSYRVTFVDGCPTTVPVVCEILEEDELVSQPYSVQCFDEDFKMNFYGQAFIDNEV